MEYESVLREIGGFGRIQFVMFLALSFTAWKAVVDLELMVLSLHSVPYRCANQNKSINEFEHYLPQQFAKDNCHTIRRQYNITNNTLFIDYNETCTEFEFTNDSIIKPTIVEQYALVCDRQHYNPTIVSVYFLGTAAGMFMGMLGDKIGRKKVLCICGVLDIITTALPVFMPTVQWQLLARFLKGLPAASYYQGLLLTEEMTELKHRAILGNMYWIFWCIGYMFCGPYVYWLRDWRKIQLVSLIYCLNYVIIFFIVPESPRWLVLRGRIQEAAQVLRRLAWWNGIKWKHSVAKIHVEAEPTGNTIELIKYPQMRIKTLITFYTLVMFAFCYFGLSTDSTFISNNIVINVVLNGAVEIPSSFIGWIFSEKFGRKWPTVLITAFSGFCIVAVPLIPRQGTYKYVQLTVAMIGKCFLTAGYCIADVWVAEIFPTSLRNNGMFLGTGVAMLGNIVAPQINALAKFALFIPGLVFGAFSFVSSFVVILLPETKGIPLPETVLSSEGFVRGREKQWARETLARERAESLLSDEGPDVEIEI